MRAPLLMAALVSRDTAAKQGPQTTRRVVVSTHTASSRCRLGAKQYCRVCHPWWRVYRQTCTPKQMPHSCLPGTIRSPQTWQQQQRKPRSHGCQSRCAGSAAVRLLCCPLQHAAAAGRQVHPVAGAQRISDCSRQQCRQLHLEPPPLWRRTPRSAAPRTSSPAAPELTMRRSPWRICHLPSALPLPVQPLTLPPARS
jgi:hypothetical protein